MPVLADERYAGAPRMSVSRCIPKRLLRNPKQRKSHLGAARFCLRVRRERDLDVVTSLDFSAMRFERREEPEVLKDGWM